MNPERSKADHNPTLASPSESEGAIDSMAAMTNEWERSVPMIPQSLPDIVDLHWVRGVRCTTDAPDLLIEVPHGATETADFEALAAQLQSPLPEGLVDFFHVNTDVGAFELAVATATQRVSVAETSGVLIVRSRIPRTFIDCNRRIDEAPESFRAGKVTPGLMPWVTHPADIALLRERHARYVDTVRTAIQTLGADAGILLLHSYAPRNVAVEVDMEIVQNLRRAYQTPNDLAWSLRPAFDVIARDPEGHSHAPTAVVDALRIGLADCGWEVADSASYPLHPSTLAWEHVMRRPGRVLCLEVRRDLLADPFDPFVRMKISPRKVEQIAKPLAEALAAWDPRNRSAPG